MSQESWFKKYRAYLIIGILIIAVVIFFMVRSNASKKAQYIFDTATLGSVSDTVAETGNVALDGQAEIRPGTDSIVEAIYVANGQHVYANQNLLKIKSLATDAQKAAADSAYLAAQSSLQTVNQAKTTLSVQILAAQKTLYDAKNNYNNVYKKIFWILSIMISIVIITIAAFGYLKEKLF